MQIKIIDSSELPYTNQDIVRLNEMIASESQHHQFSLSAFLRLAMRKR